jgi:hypothetical protein
MPQIQMALFLLWIVATVGMGFGAFLASLRFISTHSRRYHEFMSDAERIELFVREPRTYFAKAIPDGIARTNRLFLPVTDPVVEAARRLTLWLATAAITSAILGLPILWVSAGIVRRSGAVVLDLMIVALWVLLLAFAGKRRAHAAVLVVLVLAAAGSLMGTLIV